MKVFRYHRSGLAEFLATTIEVKDLADMRKKIESHYRRNIRIMAKPIIDTRLPPEWDGPAYYVIAGFADEGSDCIGMCNFYEE